MYVLLENRKTQIGQANSHYFYGHYARIRCHDPKEVKSCLASIDAARRRGKYLVGYLAYEAVYGLHEILSPLYSPDADFPLIDFYIFDNHHLLTQTDAGHLLKEFDQKTNNPAFIRQLKFNYDFDYYAACLKEIKKYIKDGETYQLNFTGKYRFQLEGSPLSLYRMLRDQQKVEFSALFAGAEKQILSFSPELFFAKKGDYLQAKPMKGTMPRESDPNVDGENKRRLLDDEKILAENMIIVDLIRNDLSVIAQPGSVNVPKLFELEEYETVYQLTSTIACRVDKEITFAAIIDALFPCGSVTGAPKLRTMQIIRALERQNRGVYTGAIGYITPENDMCFSVAIRTLCLNAGRGVMGVGGGIVYDSVIEDEFAEIHTKARFLTALATP